MIPGPIAVLLLAIGAVALSSDASGIRAVLWFSAVGLGVWLVLHPLTGSLLRQLARARLNPLQADLVELSAQSGSPDPVLLGEAQRELMRDPLYMLTYVSLWLVKWAAIAAVAGWLAL